MEQDTATTDEQIGAIVQTYVSNMVDAFTNVNIGRDVVYHATDNKQAAMEMFSGMFAELAGRELNRQCNELVEAAKTEAAADAETEAESDAEDDKPKNTKRRLSEDDEDYQRMLDQHLQEYVLYVANNPMQRMSNSGF